MRLSFVSEAGKSPGFAFLRKGGCGNDDVAPQWDMQLSSVRDRSSLVPATVTGQEPSFSETDGYVFDPIARWARETPQKMAVQSGEAVWTYLTLEQITNQIASALRARGIQTGDRVAFVLPRGAQTLLLLIGILKAGAAYVPLDAESPPGRIRECLEDAAPVLVVVEDVSAFSDAAVTDSATLLSLRQLLDSAQHSPTAPREAATRVLTPTDLAYIIFTSGTTGRPKGVPIRHESLSNFVRGCQETCIRVEPHDHVFQGFSPASDGHHEEVWPTLLAGATLLVATSTEVHSGPELTAFLNENAVTIISCAPTLLSLVEGDIPTLRRVLFGAENLPASLVKRWWRPDREILNTYGPTEATVGATFGYCAPDAPITIGKPLPNYFCYVVEDDLNALPDGAEGELGIAGIGIATGYFGRPDLSATRFVANPFALPGQKNDLLYRTGDRVKRDADGNLVWLGRIDSQVKVRGHRIELSEIESHLLADANVKTAIVVPRTNEDQETQLVALVVSRSEEAFDLATLLENLRTGLPSHMIPQSIELVERIPLLPSGKADRRACLTLHGHPVRIEREILPPRTDTEAMLLSSWQDLFKREDISCADDFFADLGGYSLLASRLVSLLRSDRGFGDMSVLELYENPTIRSLAALLEGRQTPHHTPAPVFQPVSPRRYRLAQLFQAIGVLVLFAIQGVLWLGPVISAIYYSNHGWTDGAALLLGLVLHAVSVPVVLLFAIVVKWTIGGRFRPGRYPVWGSVFLRWWFVQRVLAIAPVSFLSGTPLAAGYLRLLGARVGRNVSLESLDIDCPDLLDIGDDSILENSAWLHAAEVTGGELHLSPITLGRGCTLGVRAGMGGGAILEEGAALRDLTCVSGNVTVPAGEEWIGSPGRPAPEPILPPYDPTRQPSVLRWTLVGVWQTVLIALLTVLESLPFLIVSFTLYNRSEGVTAYLWEPAYAVGLVLLACLQALIIKWAVMGRLRPGTYAYPGGYYLRKWFSDKHLELVSPTIVPVYDSLFARSWCRALGMKCGPRCEVALPRRLPYDLVEMGEESFLASEVSIGMPIRRNGQIRLERTVVGKRVFLGNDSVVPQGTEVPDESLLGVLSLWPGADETGSAPDQAWLGAPAFRLPHRQVNADFDTRQTYRPTKRLYIERLAHEAFRIVLPSLSSLAVAAALIEAFVAVWNDTSLTVAIVCSPLLYLGGAILGAGICWLAKSILVGKYRPTVSPLWSRFVWNAETYSAVLHDFGVAMFAQSLIGTPFLADFLRLLGAKIGERAFLNTTDLTETDLLHLGADVAINANAPLQAHLFEDRVMKVGPIRIGDRCSVGTYSVILCESELKHDAHVGNLSLVMKGETIPAGTSWTGSPAQSDRG